MNPTFAFDVYGTLIDPLGIYIQNDMIWVADITHMRKFDLKTGAPRRTGRDRPAAFARAALQGQREMSEQSRLAVALLNAQIKQLRERLDKHYGFEAIVGRSAVMERVFDVLRKVAPTKMNVLITGESGTGKELAARALHDHSPRASRPFIALNTSAIPPKGIELLDVPFPFLSFPFPEPGGESWR